MTTALHCAYVWLDVNDADLPAAQNIFHGLDAGAVQIPFVLTIFHKPAESNLTPIRLNVKENQLQQSSESERRHRLTPPSSRRGVEHRGDGRGHAHSPVPVHHAVKDVSAGEVIISARLLVTFGWSGGVWKGWESLNNSWSHRNDEDVSWYVRGTAPWKS